jgi:hypothetical protein
MSFPGPEAGAGGCSLPQHGFLLKASLILGHDLLDRAPSSRVTGVEQGQDFGMLTLDSAGLTAPLAGRRDHG